MHLHEVVHGGVEVLPASEPAERAPEVAFLLRRVTPARVPGEVSAGKPLVRHETAVAPESAGQPHVEPHVAVDPRHLSRLVAAVMEVSAERWAVQAYRNTEPSCPDRPPNRFDLGGMSLLQRWPCGGDYLGLTVGGDGVFHPVWTDARHGPYRLWTAAVE